MKLALIQTDIIWESPEENLSKYDKQLSDLSEDSEIVILPEVFALGFTMEVEKFGSDIGKKAFEWMQQKSQEIDKIIVGSLLVQYNGYYYNRLYWVRPDGSFEYYDKRHLFQMGGEHIVMTAGERRVIVEHNGVKFMLQTCYDLRFPVFMRNHYDRQSKLHDYDILLFVANWPEVREHAYSTLLKARAIENQAYVVWVNRIGVDGHNVGFSGDSQVVDPYGKIKNKLSPNVEGVLYSEIDIKLLQEFRDSYKVGLDWDSFELS